MLPILQPRFRPPLWQSFISLGSIVERSALGRGRRI